MRIDPQLPVPDWLALEAAFEHNAPQTRSYFDQKTGQIVSVVEDRPEDEAVRRQLVEVTGRFVVIDPAPSREQYRWMERFVLTVDEPSLQERLVLSIDGKGAFRRFKDVLLHSPLDRDRWYAYRANLLHLYINQWLANKDVVLGAAPPWGEPEAPVEPDLPLEKHVLGLVERPSDALRSKASELVRALPAIELPCAIAYLRYLSERLPSVHD